MLSHGASTSRGLRTLEDTHCDGSQGVVSKGKKRPPKKPYVLPLPSVCTYCGAKLFRNESANFCCGQGDIELAQTVVPQLLRHLFLGNDANAKNFRKFVLYYNSSFAFTSYGVKKDHELAHTNRGIFTFRVQGQFYHFINDVLPTQEKPRYIQLYFFDTDVELWHRLQGSPEVMEPVVSALMRIMEMNPYAMFFRSLRDMGIHDESRIIIRSDPVQDQRTYSAPTTSQVAAIWVEDEGSSEPLRHDIVVYARSGVSLRVRHYYGCYDPLQYPLLFPYGDSGWHRCIYKKNTSHRRRDVGPAFPINEVLVQTADDLLDAEYQAASSADSEKKISCREYYCYRLQIRANDSSILLRSGRLLQQYIVDMYIKLESTRLDFIRGNQSVIRAELYQGVIDSYNAGQIYGANIGQAYILPASFIGCDRDLRSRYLSSMSLVQRYGKPDIFLTMTCNPRWPEIERELLPHEEAQNRPDLVARIFRAKLIELKKDIVEKKLFGNVAGYVYVIEFQKRGLPHAHFLIILDSQSKIRSPDQYDAFVSAEIPDVRENSHLHAVVLRHMMHGPCGRDFPTNACMRDGKCKNHYPRDYAEMTTNGRNSYPIYRRTRNGRSAVVREATLDNRWVVPYNPFLLAKYDCHLNVEVCSTIKAVKYLYKYIYKGHDRVAFAVESDGAQRDYDEISAFQSARWISPPEAAWRIFRFSLNEIHPNVVPLQVHLPNMQTILFRPFERLENITDDDSRKRTMLTAFFERNRTDPHARTLLYQQFPEHYVWHGRKDDKIWVPRRRGFAIGRLVYANPTEGERYYLRMLLANVRGPRSFEDLLTVDNVVLSSFQESAYRRGLLEDDNSVENSLLEASDFQMPFALRRLFATLLIYCTPKSPRLLWDRFFSALSEDYTLAYPENPRKVLQLTLKSICSIIESMGKNFSDFDFGDLVLEDDEIQAGRSKEIEEQLSIPVTLEELNAINLLNTEQKKAYDLIYSRVIARRSGAFFVDGPGGTGKTFLYSVLLAQLRKKGCIALAVASSGIAASNISGGRTANSLFKIPLDLDENPGTKISKQSAHADLIRACRLIIWDEAPMAKRQSIEHFERMLRDICGNNRPFGGKVVVFGGDFRQVLPVIPKSTLREAVDASLVMSPLWPTLEKIHLNINMRAINDPSFSDFVLRVGEGCAPYENGKDIALPRALVIKNSQNLSLLHQLIEAIYPNVEDINANSLLLTKKVILIPKNDDTEAINSILVSRQLGEAFEYKSFDEAVDITTEQYPVEFLNTLNPGGLPPHRLVLKKNNPIILLRNLDPTSGLCNGTRLICKAFSRNIIDAEIVVGHHKGERVFIPRIPLQPSPADKFPFNFRRKQFPIKLSFAMTINKSQGQTLDRVGIYLPQPVFSHGQLYVALSRAKKSSDVVVAIESQKSSDSSLTTKNIVCYEVLRRAGIM